MSSVSRALLLNRLPTTHNKEAEGETNFFPLGLKFLML
jgi:hypothetical protein